MNFNTILFRFGFNPDNFINEDRDPIKTKDGFIYEVRQRTDIRICPNCGSINADIHQHDTVEINCSETDQIIDTLRIIKTRFKCRDCGITYTPKIDGIDDGLAKNQTGKYFSNGVAEAINNNTQTLIKISYGYHDFERFRKRCMLISRYKKI